MTIRQLMNELALYPLDMEILGTHKGEVVELKIYDAQGYLLIDTDQGHFKKDFISGRLEIIGD